MNYRVLAIAVVCALIVGAAFVSLRLRTQPTTNPEKPAAPSSRPATSAPDRARPARDATTNTPGSKAPLAAPDPEPATISAPALPAPTLGTLQVDSDVPGAQVFLDRQLAGRVPVTIRDVPPGTHQLNVSAEGFEGVAERIDVTPGTREITIRLREVRLNLSLAVVHKHRLGSCKGQLIATPHGLRFEAADSSDGFTSPFADLEAFDVDYLQKNLRIRRRGREYDFSDPEGNADRLFVFHRDVTKARDRLARGDTPANE